MKSVRHIVVLVCVLSLLLMSACTSAKKESPAPASGGSAPAESKQPIKIGFIGGLTGPLAEYTTAAKELLEWAEADINASGGVLGRPIDILYTDTKVDPQLARDAVERMTKSDKVAAIIGDYYSPSTLAIVKLMDEAKVPLVSPNSNATDITLQGAKYVFRVVHASRVEAEAIAGYMLDKRGVKRIVVFTGSDGFSQSNATAFTAYVKQSGKAELVGTETYDRANTKDFTNLLAKYKDKQVDAIFLAGGLADGALIVKQAGDAGMKVSFYGTNAQARPGFNQIGGPTSVGTVLLSDYPGDASNWEQFADQGTKDFVAKFKAKFGKQPTYDHAHAYDSLMLVINAIKAAGSTDGPAVRDQILKLSPVKGAVGDRRLLPNGDSRTKIYLVRVEDGGKFTIIDTVVDDGK
ncbi:MAG TPA: ABC transporter substrate-binding protein [Symbiobacteriaceae bacterium]|nr:ABC transporter substrate-binding protein [Symbiobacteriaceae bacterium]